METENQSYPGLINLIDLESQAVESNTQIFKYAKKGVKATLFYSFAAAVKIPDQLLENILHLSSKTIVSYQLSKQNLEPVQGEHLLKLIALYNKGIVLFGTVDGFNDWLNKPFWSAEEKPIDWLITPGGVDLVAQELDLLGYGYPV